MKKKVFNLIILDESGSMSFIERQAVNGVNETIQTIRNAQKKHIEEQEHFVTLITFNSDGIKYVYNNMPADEIKELGQSDFNPSGCTPLYDAIGSGIVALRSQVKDDDTVLISIVTDGEENSSREWNQQQISKLIQTQKEKKWVFTYIGTNQDVEAVSRNLAIDNSLMFEYSASGTINMFKKELKARSRFFDRISDQDVCLAEVCCDYFDGVDDND